MDTGSVTTGNPLESTSAPAPAPAPAPVSTPMSIPDAFKGEKSLQSYKSHEDFVKSHVELTKKLGSAVWLPGEKDEASIKAEKMGRIYKALGKPEGAENYALDKFTESSTLPPDSLLKLQQFAFNNHLNQAQFDAAAEYLNSIYSGGLDQITEETKANEAAMLKEWGPVVYKQNANLAHSALKKLGGEALSQKLADRGLGSDPDLVKIFAKIGAQLLEDRAFEPGEVPGALSKADAQSKITSVMSNPDDLYHRKFVGKPGHAERIAEVSNWYRVLHG